MPSGNPDPIPVDPMHPEFIAIPIPESKLDVGQDVEHLTLCSLGVNITFEDEGDAIINLMEVFPEVDNPLANIGFNIDGKPFSIEKFLSDMSGFFGFLGRPYTSGESERDLLLVIPRIPLMSKISVKLRKLTVDPFFRDLMMRMMSTGINFDPNPGDQTVY